MIVGFLISAIFGGLAGALVSAAGGHGIGHAFLSYHAGGALTFLLFLTVTMRERPAR